MILKSNTLSIDNYYKIHVVFFIYCLRLSLYSVKNITNYLKYINESSTIARLNRLGYSSKIDISIKNHLQAMGKIIHPLFQSCN